MASPHMYVVLPSNGSMDYYPDNTLAKYKVKLSKPLILEGEYEVAMVEIIYPHRRLSVQPDEASMVIHSSTPVRMGERITKSTPKVTKKKSRRKRNLELEDLVENYSPEIGVEEESEMTYDAATLGKINQVQRYSLPAGMYENPLDLALRLNGVDNDVSFWIASDSQKFKVKLSKKIIRLELSSRMSQLLGFTKDQRRYVIKNDMEAKYLPHLEGNAHSLYIYSSIVEHQIVGDVAAPLIRVVCPDADKLGQTVSEKYIKPYYLPVSTSYIDTIDIQIRTTTGHLFPFLSGSPVVISLHFRQRKHH
jgi:hypothetical protein